jgi:hypothetical protein
MMLSLSRPRRSSALSPIMPCRVLTPLALARSLSDFTCKVTRLEVLGSPSLPGILDLLKLRKIHSQHYYQRAVAMPAAAKRRRSMPAAKIEGFGNGSGYMARPFVMAMALALVRFKSNYKTNSNRGLGMETRTKAVVRMVG